MKRPTRPFFLIFISYVFSVGVWAEADILGLTLGMTPDQARSTLQERFKNQLASLKDHSAVYEGLDGTAQRKLRSIFAEIGTDKRRIFERVTVHYTFPPAKPIATHIHRVKHFEPGKEPPFQTVYDALVKKYGEPSLEVSDNPNDPLAQWRGQVARTFVWELDKGKKNCGIHNNTLHFPASIAVDRSVDPQSCAKLFGVTINVSPAIDAVLSATFGLANFALEVQSERDFKVFQDNIKREQLRLAEEQRKHNTAPEL